MACAEPAPAPRSDGVRRMGEAGVRLVSVALRLSGGGTGGAADVGRGVLKVCGGGGSCTTCAEWPLLGVVMGNVKFSGSWAAALPMAGAA